MSKITEAQVYAVASRNGAVKLSQQPTEAQVRYYAALVVKAGVRFDVSQYAMDTWRAALEAEIRSRNG